ncbi:hypothetical protein CsatA_028708 [Cannabis sativa]
MAIWVVYQAWILEKSNYAARRAKNTICSCGQFILWNMSSIFSCSQYPSVSFESMYNTFARNKRFVIFF